MESIIVAIIAGGMSLLGVIITNISSGKAIEQKLITAQQVTDVKIEQLTEEVRKHNSFAERIPVIETELKSIDGRVTRLEERS